MDQLQCNGSAWFRRTDTPLAKQEVFASEVLNSVCVSKGTKALSLTAIGADRDGCLHVYAASSWVPM